MAFRSSFSSRSSFSRPSYSSRSYSKPAVVKQYQTKTVIVNRSVPAYGSGNTQSIGGSMAHGASSGFGAGIGFGVANNLMNGGSHGTAVQQQPVYVQQPVYAQAPQQYAEQPQQAQQAPVTYTEQPTSVYPQYQMQTALQESGSGFGTFLVICLVAAAGYMGWKLYGARIKAEIAKRGY